MVEIFIQNIYEIKNIDTIIHNLSEERYEKYISYKKPQDKLACTVSDYLIKQHIGDSKILKNEYGKPYMENKLHFNISHSGSYVILAKSDFEIGCDIEEIKPIDVKPIANRAFHVKEIEYLKAKNYDLKTFYKIWTLKESYMKMLGKGFSKTPESFYIDLTTMSVNENKNINFKTDESIENYIISICY